MLDTRRGIRKFADLRLTETFKSRLIRFLISLILALLVTYVPEYSELTLQGHHTLFILIFAAGLWMSEAIPAFAVSFLIMALEIFLLGFLEQRGDNWEIYLSPWSSPLVFLFLAGFIMAKAASKTKLDIWMAKRVLFLAGNKPGNIMTAMMGVTFTLSMFVSNTATAAMIVAILFPIIQTMQPGNPYKTGLLLSVTAAANIGGMGTIIGTPPNAIAVGLLGDAAPTFIEWMVLALPPAIILTLLFRLFFMWLYPSTERTINIDVLHQVHHHDDSNRPDTRKPMVASWKKSVVVLTFMTTILLWLTGPWHGIPTTVVSFVPIVVFTMVGILDSEEIRSLNWDVIILIVGGLSLGMAVASSGLDLWLAGWFAEHRFSAALLVVLFAYLVVVLSNFMSNTAAANILLPLVAAAAVTLGHSSPVMAVVTVTLSASLAMCLPVSTPPNAIVFASGMIKSRNFLFPGFLAGTLGPLVILVWVYWLSKMFP